MAIVLQAGKETPKLLASGTTGNVLRKPGHPREQMAGPLGLQVVGGCLLWPGTESSEKGRNRLSQAQALP